MDILSRLSILSPAALAAVLVFAPLPATATDIQGQVQFSGSVSFASPIPGIALDDLEVATGPGIDATGNGEHCSIVVDGSAPVNSSGNYPETGTFTATIELSHGGMMVPDGTCLVQIRASGTDGATVSAYGTTTVEVAISDFDSGIPVPVDAIVARQSKTIAGLDNKCRSWIKKDIKTKGKCNVTLWKLGGTDGSLKCKSVAIDEPVACDPANYTDEVVKLSFGDMNQQTDAVNADKIDLETKLTPVTLVNEAKCQRNLAKIAVNFLTKRNTLVEKTCVEKFLDSDSCRNTATSVAKPTLDAIDDNNCVNSQATDGASGLVIPDVDEPCRAQCISAGTITRKCIKDCFEFELSTLSNLMVGDVPVCGNGVVQAGGGEFCDDGNLTNGDCCSSTCTNEPDGSQTCGVGACFVSMAKCHNGEAETCTPGTPGVEAGHCADTFDNDCDGLTDTADTFDCP